MPSLNSALLFGGLVHSGRVEALRDEEFRPLVRRALAEDIGSGDVTTLATVPETATATAVMRAHEPLVVAGLALAEAAFAEVSASARPPSSSSRRTRTEVGGLPRERLCLELRGRLAPCSALNVSL